MKHFTEDGKEVIVNQAAIDWITLTFTDGNIFDRLTERLEDTYGKSLDRDKVGGYVGFIYGGNVKLLSGWQGGQVHFMLMASGYEADKFFRDLRRNTNIITSEMKCTRIDIQVTTLPLPKRKRLSKIGADLESGKYGTVKNRREMNIRSIASKTGDTVYIGSPSSEKMTRIYDKRLINQDGELLSFERYEIQLRKNTAQKVFEEICNQGIGFASMKLTAFLKGESELLPEKIHAKLSISKWKTQAIAHLVTRAMSMASESNRLKWLRRMSNTIMRACAEPHPNGLIAQQILLDIVIKTLMFDEMEDAEKWSLTRETGEFFNAAHLDYNNF